jgi:hypothetical protein
VCLGVDSRTCIKNFYCSVGRYGHMWEGNILINLMFKALNYQASVPGIFMHP